MIPINNTQNPIQLLLQLLSMIQPVSAAGQSGHENQKATISFKNAIQALESRPIQNGCLDHSVKIIKVLLSNHCNHDVLIVHPSKDAEPYRRSAENANPKMFQDSSSFYRFIQSSIARLVQLSAQGEQKAKPFSLVCESADRLIKEIDRSVRMMTIDTETKAEDRALPNRESAIIQFVAIQLKPAMEHLIAAIQNFDGETKELFHKVERKESSSMIPRPGRDALQSNFREGEKSRPSRPDASHSIVKETENQEIKHSALFVKPAPMPTVNFSRADFSPPIFNPIQANRTHMRESHESISAPAAEIVVTPAGMPFVLSAPNSSFLTSRRKKEKKKDRDDEDQEEREQEEFNF
jgi:hypothetical protein